MTRAPYYPVDGAIELVFNSLQTSIFLRLYQIENGPDLIHAIMQSIQSMTDFATYFRSVGFVVP